MVAILGETKIFENRDGYSAEIPCGSQISLKSLYLAQFLRYKHFFLFYNFCEDRAKNWDGYCAEIP